MNVKMYTMAREATTKARNVASAIQQTQRQVTDDNKDIKDKVDKNSQVRAKRKAELEVGAAKTAKNLASKQKAIATVQAIVAAVQTVVSIGAALGEAFGKGKDDKKPEKQENAQAPELNGTPSTQGPSDNKPSEPPTNTPAEPSTENTTTETSTNTSAEKTTVASSSDDNNTETNASQQTNASSQSGAAGQTSETAPQGVEQLAQTAGLTEDETAALNAALNGDLTQGAGLSAEGRAGESEQVKNLQSGLNKIADSGALDAETSAAIKSSLSGDGKFGANGDGIDGKFGAGTQGALDKVQGAVGNSEPPAQEGSNNPAPGVSVQEGNNNSETVAAPVQNDGGSSSEPVSNAANSGPEGGANNELNNVQSNDENASRNMGDALGVNVNEDVRARVTAGAESVGQGVENVKDAIGGILGKVGDLLNAGSDNETISAISKAIQKIIEELKKAAGIQVDGGVFSDIVKNSSNLGELLATGSYTDDKGQKIEANDFGQAIGQTLIQPLANTLTAALETPFAALGNAADKALERRNSDRSDAPEGESTTDSETQKQVSQAISSGALSADGETALRQSITQSLQQQNPNITQAEITDVSNQVVGETRAAIANQNLVNAGSGLSMSRDAEGKFSAQVNGQSVELSDELVRDLSSNDPTVKQAALQSVQSLANAGGLGLPGGEENMPRVSLDNSGMLTIGAGEDKEQLSVAALGSGQSSGDLQQRSAQNVAALLGAAFEGKTISNVASRQGGFSAEIEGQTVALSNDNIQQLQAAQGLGGITAGLVSGSEAGAPAQLQFQVGNEKLNSGQLSQVGNIAKTLNLMQGAGLQVGSNGQLSISGIQGLRGAVSLDNLNQTINQVQSAMGNTSLQGASYAQLQTLSALRSVAGASELLSLQGAKLGEKDSINLQSGLSVSSGARGSLEITANSGAAIQAFGGTGNGGTLTLNPGAISALGSDIRLSDQAKTQVGNALKAGLALAQGGAQTNLNFASGAASLTTGNTQQNTASAEVIDKIAKGTASNADLASFGVTGASQVAATQLASRGLNLSDASLVDGDLTLKNGASISGSALSAFNTSNTSTNQQLAAPVLNDSQTQETVSQINDALALGDVTQAGNLLSAGRERLQSAFGFTQDQAERALSFNYTQNVQGKQTPSSANFDKASVEATASNQRLQTNTAFQAFVGTVGNQNSAAGVRLDFANAGNNKVLNTDGFSIQSGDSTVRNGKDMRSLAAGNERGQSVGQNLLRIGRAGTNDTAVTPTQIANQILGQASTRAGNGVDLTTTTQATDSRPQSNRVSDLWSSAGRSWRQAGRNIGIGGPDGNSMRDTTDKLQRAGISQLQGTAMRELESVIAGRSLSGLSKTDMEALKGALTTKLTTLGFDSSEIKKILQSSERFDGQGRGTGVFDLSIREGQIGKALNGAVDVTQNRNNGNGNISFDVSLNAGADRFRALNKGTDNLGGVNISSRGEITGHFAPILNSDRADAVGQAIASQLRTQLGVSDISIYAQGPGTVQLAADGSLTGLKIGGRMVSTEQFAREVLQSKQSGPVSDAQVQNLVKALNQTAQTASQGASSQIGRGGSRGGMSTTAQAALDNLNASMRAAGVDPNTASIKFDGDGGANIRFGDGNNAPTFNISKEGALTQTNPTTDISALEAFLGASGVSSDQLETVVGTYNGNQAKIENLQQMIDSSMRKQGGSTAERIFGGIFSFGLSEAALASGNARTQNLNVRFNDAGQIIGANVGLNNGNSFDLNINQETGTFAASNFRDENGRSIGDPTNGGSARLLQQLRQGGLGESSKDNGSLISTLTHLGAAPESISIEQKSNRAVAQGKAEDQNRYNNKFTEEGRLKFTLNTQAGQSVDFNLKMGFDENGHNYVSTENLSGLQKQAITDRINAQRATEGQGAISSDAALLLFQRQFGGANAGYGMGAITDQNGQLITASGDLKDEQKRNRDEYAAQVTSAEGTAVQAGGRLAGIHVLALVGDAQATAILGGNDVAQKRSRDFQAAVAGGDRELAQTILDQALAANGMTAGSITLDELFENGQFASNGTFKSGDQLRSDIGYVNVETGFDGRSAKITGNVQTGPDNERTSFAVNQRTDGTRTYDVKTTGTNADKFSSSLRDQLPSNEKSGLQKTMDVLGDGTKYLGIALEAALPGIQALKKALEELEEARIQEEAAKKQLGEALAYARDMGITFGALTDFGAEGGGEGGEATVDRSGNVPVQNIPQQAPSGQTDAASQSPIDNQQNAQSDLLEQISGDANFANVAVLIGMNPGLLIQQAQQLEMLEELSSVIVELQSPMGNPVQEMQRFVEQLQARLNEAQLPQDAPFVGGA